MMQGQKYIKLREIVFHFDRACDSNKLFVVSIVAVFTAAKKFDYSWFQALRTVLIKI